MKTIKFFWVSVFIISILGMVTAAYDCEQEVREGEAHEKAEMWSTAGIDYGIACGCYDRQMKDYDAAIKYCEKSSEMFEKAEILSSAGGTHLTLAEIYSKKGGNEDKIKEHCEISKELLLKSIEEEFNRWEKTNLRSAGADYLTIAKCYKLIKDDKNACEYCKNAVRYGSQMACEFYGCPKSTSGTSNSGTGNTNTGTSGTLASGSGELPIIIILGIVVVIALAVFFLKRKKEK